MKKRIFVIYIVCMLVLTSLSFGAIGEKDNIDNQIYKNNLSTLDDNDHYVVCFIIGNYDEKTKDEIIGFELTSDNNSIVVRGVYVVEHPENVEFIWSGGTYKNIKVYSLFFGICFGGFVIGIAISCRASPT